jgi:hypothetical protein
MGSLTDTGYQNALDLGTYIGSHYIHQHKLLPAHKLDPALLHVESTAVQRTVTTLRGVLGGLYPNTSGTVRVAVRSREDEVMGADWYGCPLLANLTAQLTDAQAAQGEGLCYCVCRSSMGLFCVFDVYVSQNHRAK